MRIPPSARRSSGRHQSWTLANSRGCCSGSALRIFATGLVSSQSMPSHSMVGACRSRRRDAIAHWRVCQACRRPCTTAVFGTRPGHSRLVMESSSTSSANVAPCAGAEQQSEVIVATPPIEHGRPSVETSLVPHEGHVALDCIGPSTWVVTHLRTYERKASALVLRRRGVRSSQVSEHGGALGLGRAPRLHVLP